MEVEVLEYRYRSVNVISPPVLRSSPVVSLDHLDGFINHLKPDRTEMYRAPKHDLECGNEVKEVGKSFI